MIKCLSSSIPSKVTRSFKQLSSILNEINALSGRDYRLYFDDTEVLLLDVTKNKILWIEDTSFSVAVLVARLNKILEYWRYEKIINKDNLDFMRALRIKQEFKSFYLYE